MTLSVVILPAKVLADGTHKIRIAFAHNGQTRYYNTRFIVPSTDCLKNGSVIKVGNASYINQQLRVLQSKMYEIYDTLDNAEYYSCSQLLSIIKERMCHTNVHSFGDIAQEWLDYKRSRCVDSSMYSYNYGVSNFIKFAGKDFVLSTLSEQMIYEYDKWLSSFLVDATVNIRMNVLHDIVNFAIARKFITFEVNPFDNYNRHPKTIRHCELPVSVIRQLRTLESDNEKIIICRDVILLSLYLAGMNAADLFSVDLSGNSISFNRQKTKNRRKSSTPTMFTIQPEAKEILNKYLKKDGTISFGKANTLDKLNNILKSTDKLAQAIGYKGRLIYLSGRKTFSQLAYLLGIQDRVILYCIGDSAKAVGEGMLGFYTYTNIKMADNAIRKVLDFIASDLTEDDLFTQQ